MTHIKTNLLLICCLIGLYAQQTGIAIKNLNVRTQPSISSEVVDVISSGTLGKVKKTSNETEIIDQSREFEYHWYEVEFDNGINGWVFGQYFYTHRKEIGTFSINETIYQLNIFEENGQLNDEPYNDQYRIPVIIKGHNDAHMIQYDESFTIPPEGHKAPYFCLVGNTAIHESIKTVPQSSQSKLHLEVQVSHQIGGGSYTLVLTQKNGQFHAIDVHGYSMTYTD